MVEPGPDPIVSLRERLVQALEECCRTRRHDSPELRRAVAEFARGATHVKLDRKWVLNSIQDMIDALVPAPDEYRRRTLGDTARRMVEDADVRWPTVGSYPR